jgi:hypothetical protein
MRQPIIQQNHTENQREQKPAVELGKRRGTVNSCWKGCIGTTKVICCIRHNSWWRLRFMLKKRRECLDGNAHARPMIWFVLQAERCHRCKLQSTGKNHSVFKFVSSCFLGSDSVRVRACTEKGGKKRQTLATPFGGYLPFNLGSTHSFTLSSVKRGIACVHKK